MAEIKATATATPTGHPPPPPQRDAGDTAEGQVEREERSRDVVRGDSHGVGDTARTEQQGQGEDDAD